MVYNVIYGDDETDVCVCHPKKIIILVDNYNMITRCDWFWCVPRAECT